MFCFSTGFYILYIHSKLINIKKSLFIGYWDLDASRNELEFINTMKFVKKGKQQVLSGCEKGLDNVLLREINDHSKRQENGKKDSPDAKHGETQKCRPDSPGLDLSIFQPRGKRKCVIQNEGKRGKEEEWWSADDADDCQLIQKIDSEGEDRAPKARKTKSRTKKRVKKNTDASNEDVSSPASSDIQQTYRCYVFSTGMANRAGHAVEKGLYSTIGDYHAAQKWDTPYLNAETHCRPFIPNLEDEEKDKELNVDLGNSSPLHRVDDNNTSIRESEVLRERRNSIEIWQREQDMEAAKQMSCLANHTSVSVSESFYPSLVSTSSQSKTLKNNTENDTPDLQNVLNVKTEDEKSNESNLPVSAFTEVKPKQDCNRKLEVSNCHQSILGPLQNYTNVKSNSYPADVTSQVCYQPPKGFFQPHDVCQNTMYSSVHSVRSENGNRPSVLNMSNNRKDVKAYENGLIPENSSLINTPVEPRHVDQPIIRSTLDVAEKALKESRGVSMLKSSVPILPRDVNHSAFMSRQSMHPQPVMFNYSHKMPIHGRFSPPISMHLPPVSIAPSVTLHSRNAFDHTQMARSSPKMHHTLNHIKTQDTPNGYDRDVSLSEKYNYLAASFNSSRHQHSSERPSSLPMPLSSNRIEKKTPTSFSVESLTGLSEKDGTSIFKSRNGHERIKEIHNSERLHENIQQHPSDRQLDNRLDRTHTDRECVSNPSDRLIGPTDRMHIPGGIHNGLKRSLDERIIERSYDKHSFDLSRGKDRYMFEKERFNFEKDRFYDKERSFLHHNLLLQDPRSPMHLSSPLFLPRTLPIETNSAFSHLHRSDIRHLSARFPSR
ncbi:uncharacterized protein LOC100211249 isoform X1 [Hydra vulgaris]|uniref:uncharacterized protein LOC100211249 isoform X1 n=1 Tax=Hydra vulgaris TaxID=6087 RepID=UPI0032EA556E